MMNVDNSRHGIYIAKQEMSKYHEDKKGKTLNPNTGYCRSSFHY